ncbi:MAG TPA: TetR/AcrR family transcriptional regulator [Ktedonobacteraceae bacterium]
MAQTSPRWTQEIQGREEEQRQLKRAALLRTAARIFNKMGFHQTTLVDLAKALNVTKPTLYSYIKSKDDILLECQRLALEQFQGVVELAQEHGATGLERLRYFFFQYAELATQDFGICILLFGDQQLNEENRLTLRAERRELDRAVRHLIEEGIADGSIAPCDPRMTTFALFGAFNWMVHWYQEEGKLSPHQIAEQFLAVFQNGLISRNPS